MTFKQEMLCSLLDDIEREMLVDKKGYNREKMKVLIEEYLEHCVCFGSYEEWHHKVFGNDK